MSIYLERLLFTLAQIPMEKVEWVTRQLRDVRKHGACVYVLGNGGSEALAQHLVLHLRGCEIRAFDLMADPAWLTATSNDYGYNNAAIALLDVLFKPKDMLLIISGSGESENVKAAVRCILPLYGDIAAILGNHGGRVGEIMGYSNCVILPGLDYGPLEDAFSAVIHMIYEGLK